MADRLSALDVSFLYLEEPTTPLHVGEVLLLQAPEAGFDYARLVRLIADRIALVPRYRQRVREVPGHLANPVWVDDADFDISYHVRRSALPRPGSDEQLRELVGRIMSRPLDRSRPLWEMYLVEGLERGRFAILSKTHHAMVDGRSGLEIAQVILDPTPDAPEAEVPAWTPAGEPSVLRLVAGAVADAVTSPASALDSLRAGTGDLRQAAGAAVRQAVGMVTTIGRAARPPAANPLTVEIGGQRRYGMVATRLEDYKRVRAAHGGTVNDAVLAVVAGALRAWLLTRGEPVGPRSSVRAMVPVSVRAVGADELGTQVAAFPCDLPVGEPDPVVRLQRIAFEMAQHKDTGRLMDAEAITALAGFAAPTLHSLGARAANSLARRTYSLVVTNVPGPQVPLYASGARLLASHPVVPLTKGHAVSVGLTSYDGGVYYGLNADRDSMPDVDLLADAIADSLDELVDTAEGRRAPGRAIR